MWKHKKVITWFAIVSLVISLFSGAAVITAGAEGEPTLSKAYPEATDFMTHYLLADGPLMDNTAREWTDLITAEEANRVIDALLYKSLAKYNWPHPLFDAGETVTGTALLTKAQTYLGWSYRTLDVLVPYFRLTDGIEGYKGDAALTREQAAQMFLNLLRATPEYAWNGNYAQDGVTQVLKLNDDELGLTYELTRDGMGRPSYQWKRDGVAITAVYAAKPIFVSSNAATTYATIMNTLGYTPAIDGGWHYPMNKFGVNLINEGAEAMTGWYFIDGKNGNTLGGVGTTVAVYDAYYAKSYILEGNYFCSRMYDVVTYCDLLADVKTEGGEKKVNMYGQVGGYGYWAGQTNVQAAEDGKYIVRWNNISCQVQDVVKAQSVVGKLTAYANGTVTIDDAAKITSARLYMGHELLSDANLGKVCTFYLDTLGNVIGVEEGGEVACDHIWEQTEHVPATDDTPGYTKYVCKNDPTHTKQEDHPALVLGRTNYAEAVAVLKALGICDTTNENWMEAITGAEANKILQALYDAPGFVAAWSPDFDAKATVTGAEFISDALVTIGWSYGNDALWGKFQHLERGLNAEYNAIEPLTREEAAQITLNVLRGIPTYNGEVIKANDPGFGMTLVFAGEDAYKRPSYKWQIAGVDVTEAFADTPVAKVRGGATWNEILNAVGYVTDPGIAPSQFRWSQEGGEFTDWVTKVHSDESTLLDKAWVLEIYADYTTAHTGWEFSIVAYRSDEVLPGEEKPDTKYLEAVELMVAIGFMDGNNKNWKQSITGAEANKILQALYDAPGFVAEWHPDFSANGKVKASEFCSDALVTIGWNYNNDALFTAYNHLEKGLKSDYSSNKYLTREEAAQITLNVLKAIPTYNPETIKANDPGIGLTLVKTGTDSKGRPYYKWQRNGADVTDSYRDTPVTTMYGGVVWSDILTACGDVGEINIAQYFRVREAGGDWSSFSEKMHPCYDLFKTSDWAVEVFVEYDHNYTTYAYSVLTYEGALSNPDAGDHSNTLLAAVIGVLSLSAVCVLVINEKKKNKI